MLNPFSVYSNADLAQSINIVPNSYGRLNQLNLFPVKGVMTRTITIEEQNGVLAMLPSGEYGGQSTAGKQGKRNVRTFQIPHIPHDELILASEIQDIRAFGGDGMASLDSLVNQKLATARAKHDITLEFLRMGALKGTIVDGDGSTTLFNLYAEFGITQKNVDFLLGTAGTDVRAKCAEVVRHIEDNALGENIGNVHCLVSQEFMDKLTNHANVKAAYANWNAAQSRLGGDVRAGFEFGGIMFEEYRATATNGAGTTTRFIASNDGHAFPLGTLNTFNTFAGPADFVDSVNRLGQVYYAKIAPIEFDRGYKLHTQANVLPICARPALCVRVTSSN